MAFLKINGQGALEIQLETGRLLYEEAAKERDAISLFRLGQAHQEGLWGYEKDQTIANKYYELAYEIDPSLVNQR